MQKVITVHVLGNNRINTLQEYTFPKLQEALAEGYEIKDFQQMSSSAGTGSLGGVYLTFILFKEGIDKQEGEASNLNKRAIR